MTNKAKAFLLCLLGSAFFSHANAEAEKETKYLAFQIFTYFSPDPKVAHLMSSGTKEPLVPGSAALRDYVLDIKQRIGTTGDKQTRLAVMLGLVCFEQDDATVAQFVEKAFDLALETDVAVGFHIDDSMFWLRRKDLWSDPQNVEAMDWDGTPSTGRRLDWGRKPTEAPPQMCFNSKVIQREVQQRATLLGKAIQAGVNRLHQLKKPELFAGVIAGSETMIGQDFETGKYLGYRALLNRGFTREHPPQDMGVELEKVVQEFIDLWTNGLAGAGVSPQQIYSHTAFLSRRSFGRGDSKEVTYMRHNGDNGYSQHNHFAPPSVAFGANHRPGFSTYPQPGLFEDIYNELASHKQVAWASCEGTNMQPASGPGQTGMNIETYLAKMFNHGGALVNIFAWGIGGEAMKHMDYRQVTEGEDALQAYRKFLKGEPLVEAKDEGLSLFDRLPPKIHQIQKELPAWIEKTADKEKAAQAAALMQVMQTHLKAKKLDETEKAADAILKMMGAQTATPEAPKTEPLPLMERLPAKIQKIQKELPAWIKNADDKEKAMAVMQKLDGQLKAKDFDEADKTADSILKMIGGESQPSEPKPDAAQGVPLETREKLAHNIGCSFLLFRDQVQAELKLTSEQKEKLDQRLRELLPDAMQVASNGKGDREKYNERAHEEMAAVLKETLSEGQRTRLHQLQMQKDGLFGPAWNMTELRITDAQRKQFMAPTQETQQKTQALMAEIQKGANPDEIRPKAFHLRLDLEAKLEALLTDAQKKQWLEMLGKPVNPGVIYGGL